MAVRKALRGRGPISPIHVANTEREWTALMREALQLAAQTKDPRLTTLQAAVSSGQAEACLRRLGIVCPADLKREFPVKT